MRDASYHVSSVLVLQRCVAKNAVSMLVVLEAWLVWLQ